jgi:glycosyltransferase involved in cell wall biosynthesis
MARVCMVVFNEYCCDGRVRREAEALVERGDTVDCICVSDRGLTELGGVRLFCLSGKRYRGANMFRVLLGYAWFFCFAFYKVTALHLRNPYDIVQAHTMPDFLIFTALIPKLLGAKAILDVHDLMPEVYAVKFGSPRRKWIVRLITWAEVRSVAFADKAMCVHKPHLDVLTEHGNPRDKFSVLLNVPDHHIFVPQKPAPGWDKNFQLIYHGTTPKRAGLETALRAVAVARKEIPHLRFHIVGVGEGLDRLTQMIRELGLGDSVKLSPSIPVEQLPEIIGQAHVGIVPYQADVFTQYVLPTKLLEYGAIGVPAITSRLRTVEAYFDSSMVAFFEPGDELDLSRQIIRLYRNPELAAGLAANLKNFVDAYSWPQQRQIYYRLVDSLAPSAELSLT